MDDLSIEDESKRNPSNIDKPRKFSDYLDSGCDLFSRISDITNTDMSDIDEREIYSIYFDLEIS